MRYLRFLPALLLCGPAFAQSVPPKIVAPTGPNDAANKAFVDAAIAALSARLPAGTPGTANGAALLDSASKLPAAELPNSLPLATPADNSTVWVQDPNGGMGRVPLSTLRTFLGTTSSATPPATTFVAQVSALPNVVVTLDAAIPAGTAAVVAGTPAIQVDADKNIIALSSPDGGVYAHGYGAAKLVTTGGPAGKPVFHDTSIEFNGGFEALNIPQATAANLVRANQSYTATFVVKPVVPSNGDLLRFRSGNSGFSLHGVGGADCAMRIEDNRGSAIAQETSSAGTACGGAYQVFEALIRNDNSTLSLLRNGAVAITTPTGPVNGFMPAVAQFMNNCGCDLAFAEITVGIGTLAQRNAELSRLAAFYNIGGTTTITYGPSGGIPPAAVAVPDPTIVNMMTSLNHPTGPLPNAAGAVLGSGLPTTGFTSVINAIFGTAPGQVDGNGVRAGFEMNYNGATQAIGEPGDTGQSPGNSPFHARARHYPVGDPNDLLPVMADGLHMRAVCSQAGNTDCSNGNVWGAFLRDSGADFRPGKTAKFRYKSPKGQHSWNPLWFFPPAGGVGGNLIEIDANDNFPRFGEGTATGYQVDFGAVNIYGANVNVGIYRAYAANGGGFKYVEAGPSFYEMPFDWSADFHDLVLSWDLTTEVLSEFADGKLFAQVYQPFAINCNKDAGGNCIGLNTLFGNQAIANFTPGASTAINNDGIPDGWTLTLQQYAMFNGALTPAQALAYAPAGAVNATPILNANGPTPPAGQHGLTANNRGTAATPTTAAQTIGSNPFVVKWTGAFTQGDLDYGVMTFGKWGNFTDEMRGRVIPGGKMEVCWFDVNNVGTVLIWENAHACLQSTVAYQFQPDTFYDLEWDGNPGAGTATFFANPAGAAVTRLGAAAVNVSHNYYHNNDVATVPMSVVDQPQEWHIGQGNNDTRDNPVPPDGRLGLSGTWTKASLSINGTTVLAPVVGAAAITDASPGNPVWTAYTPALGGSAVFDSHLQAGGPAATPPPLPLVPAGTEPVVATLGGFSFRPYALAAGTTVTQTTAGTSPVVLSAPGQTTETYQGVMTPMAAGPGTWTASLTGAGPSGLTYASGLVLGQAGLTSTSVLQSFQIANSSYDVLFHGSVNIDGGGFPFNATGSSYCLRAVRDATNWTFLGAAAPCAAGSFVQITQKSLATLGTVDAIGPFARPQGASGNTPPGGVTMTAFGYVASAAPQAAGP